MKILCILLCVAFASGFYIDSNETHENKILGGNHIRIEDVPYQAILLGMRQDNICGATIIHKFWVLTAAHCVEGKTHLSVRTGSGHRNEKLGTVHKAEEVIIPTDYDKHTNNDDIALIKLEEPIKFDDKQQPIALAKPYDSPREGESMQISGFGRLGEFRRFSDILKAAHVPVVNQEDCKRAYILEPINDNMFCAGNGAADTCEGDSGGPAVIHGKLYGITSSGKYCGSKRFPGIYTRVDKYYNWIEEKTGLKF